MNAEERAVLLGLVAKPAVQMTVNELYEVTRRVAGILPELLTAADERDRLLKLLRRAWRPLDYDADPGLWREIEAVLDGEGVTGA